MQYFRRLFITFLEEGKLSAPTGDDEKLAKFRTWLLKQFKALQSVLLQIAAPPDDTADGAIDLELQVAAIRTIIEVRSRSWFVIGKNRLKNYLCTVPFLLVRKARVSYAL